MTTYIAFTPSLQAPFQFQATLDGQIYTIQCTWNLFGQRFYINVYDLSNNLIVARPQVGSPPTYNLNLVAGYFFSSVLVYRQATGNFEIDPATPPGLAFPPIPPNVPLTQYFVNDGNALVIGYALGYPVSTTGFPPAILPAGAVYNNGQTVCIVPGVTPDPSAAPVYFGQVTPQQLLALGGGNLPTTAPTGSLQLYSPDGQIFIA